MYICTSVRYVLKLAYDGSSFYGWQSQANGNTIQQVIEAGLKKITRCDILIMGCGRTDTGVHAKEFYAHFEWDQIPEEKFLFKLNNTTPSSIAFYDCFQVTDNFHARFSATSRKYEYHILSEPNPFHVNWAYFRYGKLDVEAMNEGCTYLLQLQNFKSFSKVNTDVKTFLCNLMECRFEQNGPLLVFHVKANRFLRNMVRAMVGTLLDMGTHKINLQDLKNIMESGNRSEAGLSVPAKGLFLTEVNYNWEQYRING